jgi:hypothetical protein
LYGIGDRKVIDLHPSQRYTKTELPPPHPNLLQVHAAVAKTLRDSCVGVYAKDYFFGIGENAQDLETLASFVENED